jgi:hypothetical protein
VEDDSFDAGSDCDVLACDLPPSVDQPSYCWQWRESRQRWLLDGEGQGGRKFNKAWRPGVEGVIPFASLPLDQPINPSAPPSPAFLQRVALAPQRAKHQKSGLVRFCPRMQSEMYNLSHRHIKWYG